MFVTKLGLSAFAGLACFCWGRCLMRWGRLLLLGSPAFGGVACFCWALDFLWFRLLPETHADYKTMRILNFLFPLFPVVQQRSNRQNRARFLKKGLRVIFGFFSSLEFQGAGFLPRKPLRNFGDLQIRHANFL